MVSELRPQIKPQFVYFGRGLVPTVRNNAVVVASQVSAKIYSWGFCISGRTPHDSSAVPWCWLGRKARLVKCRQVCPITPATVKKQPVQLRANPMIAVVQQHSPRAKLVRDDTLGKEWSLSSNADG